MFSSQIKSLGMPPKRAACAWGSGAPAYKVLSAFRTQAGPRIKGFRNGREAESNGALSRFAIAEVRQAAAERKAPPGAAAPGSPS
jgi:hypothetical protein